MSRLRRLYSAQQVAVAVRDRRPVAVAGVAVSEVREHWVFGPARWWTERPLHRVYYELVLADGRNLTVYRDVGAGTWHRQRG